MPGLASLQQVPVMSSGTVPMGSVPSISNKGVEYENAEFEPEYLERIVEVPRVRVDHVEKIIEVPEVQMVDRIVEIPQVQDVLEMNEASMAYGGGYGYGGGPGGGPGGPYGGGPGGPGGYGAYDFGSSLGQYSHFGDGGPGGGNTSGKTAAAMLRGKGYGRGGRKPVKVITREVPKIEVKQVERIVEVPNIEYEDRIVEVREVREVVRRVPRIEVREIPIERVIQVPKRIVQEIEQPKYRPVPHLVRQQVEREIPIAKPYVQTVEVVKQVAVPTNENGVPLADQVSAPDQPPPAVVNAPIVMSQYTLPPVPAPSAGPETRFSGGAVGSMPSVPTSMAPEGLTPPMPLYPQSQGMAQGPPSSGVFYAKGVPSRPTSASQSQVAPGSFSQAPQTMGQRESGYMTPPTPPVAERSIRTMPGGPVTSMAGAPVYAMTPGAMVSSGSVPMQSGVIQSGVVDGTMRLPTEIQQQAGPTAQFASMGMVPPSRGNPFSSMQSMPRSVASSQAVPPPATTSSAIYQTYGASTPPMAPASAQSMQSQAVVT